MVDALDGAKILHRVPPTAVQVSSAAIPDWRISQSEWAFKIQLQSKGIELVLNLNYNVGAISTGDGGSWWRNG
jgi:hypothetical protein